MSAPFEQNGFYKKYDKRGTHFVSFYRRVSRTFADESDKVRSAFVGHPGKYFSGYFLFRIQIEYSLGNRISKALKLFSN